MRKVALLCLAAVLSLSVMGFGFAKWSSTVGATVDAKTGSYKLAWVNNSMIQHDKGPDWHAKQGLVGVDVDSELKDVGSTSGSFEDTDKDGFLDRYNVTIDNAYPYYYNEISGKITNAGTIPLIIQKPTLHWQGNALKETELTIEDGFVYWLGADGRVIRPTQEQINTPLKYGVGDNWVLELRWMDNADRQIHPGQIFEESFELQVLQPAAQAAKYNFGISVEAIQWNEIR